MLSLFVFSCLFVFGFFAGSEGVEAQPYAGFGWCPPTGCDGGWAMNVSGPFGTSPGNLTACPISGMGCMAGQNGYCTGSDGLYYSYICENSGGGGGGGGGGGTTSNPAPSFSYTCNAAGTQARLSFSGTTYNSTYALRIDANPVSWSGACPAASPDFCGNVTGNQSPYLLNTVPGANYTAWIHTYDISCGAFGCSTPTPGAASSITVNCPPPPPPAPVPDLRINGSDGPISVIAGSNLNLTWDPVVNATSCTAIAGAGWQGAPKNTNGGNDSIPATITSTYTLSCTGAGGTRTDSVVVNVNAPPPPPLTVPVISHVCDPSGTSVTLNYGVPTATAYYLRIDEAEPSWNGLCTAPDRCIDATANSSYSGPVLPGVRYGSWVHAYRGADPPANSAYYVFQCNAPTLTVGVTATPASGTAPLNSTVTASVGGSATGTINYHFYCDGANLTQSYLAQPATPFSHICSYPVAGTYTPRVRVERGAALPIAGSATVVVGAPPACTGPIPGLASLCSGDDSGLLANTPRTLAASCSVPAGSNPKCQYSCVAPATYNASSGACELCGVCGSAGNYCEGERWADNCGNANACGPGTKDCRKFWKEVAP